MRRWLLRILVFLFLGAIVNVVVAWAAAGLFSVPAIWRTVRAGADDTDAWNHLVPHDLRSQPVFASSAGNWGVHFRCVVATPIPDHLAVETDDDGRVTKIELFDMGGLPNKDKDFDHAMLARAGWPCVSMSGAFWRDDDLHRVGTASEMLREAPTNATRLVAATIFNRPTGGARSEYRLIPLAPIWPGFAINTVFYACILWLLFAGPFVLRRRRRIRRGLCPKCAYDLRGTTSETCPECGGLLPSPSR